MGLSHDLISQFVKVTNDQQTEKKETIAYGTAVELDGKKYVRLDGSDMLTPVSSTADAEANERVTVLIKDHTATITGNASSPAARKQSVDDVVDQITEVEILVADKVSTDDFDAERGRINTLVSENVTITERLTASEANIEKLKTDKVSTKELEAQTARIDDLETNMLTVGAADIKYATIESLEATDGDFRNLESDYASFKNTTTDNLTSVNASITNLNSTYAKIDFANIGEAAVENFYAASGIIQNLTLETGVVVKELVGVKIKGDLIEGNTIQADKLVVKGSDGLYYKLNIEGGATATEQVSEEDLQNGLSGSIIVAKSITANQIAVDDLVAFGATIGGFHIVGNSLSYGITEEDIDVINAHFENLTSITAKYENMEAINAEIENLKARYADFDRVTAENVEALNVDIENLRTAFTNETSISAEDLNVANSEIDNLKAYNASFTYSPSPGSIYSGVKSSVDNTTKGAYLDSDGKFSFGDSDNFIKFYEDQNGAYKLEISADSILFGSNKKSVENIEEDIDNVLEKTEYISVGTDNGKPYIELGKGDSDFKVKITNEEIQFNDGQTTPAYISNQKLMIEKAQVDNELRFGNFVWKERKNGNMGLTWEEVNS